MTAAFTTNQYLFLFVWTVLVAFATYFYAASSGISSQFVLVEKSALSTERSQLNNASTRAQVAQASVNDPVNQQKLSEDKKAILTPSDKATVSAGTNNVRIMCMIFTMPSNWETKARAVRLTWAQRCTRYMFFYSRTSSVHLPEAFALDVPEGRDHLTAKTMAALRLSFENYKDSIDWFLKADDDTFIIMENMKHLLSSLDPRKPHYIGGRSTDFLKNGYNGGGAGYLLSWESARSVVEESDRFGCALDRGYEDLEVGKCLANFHIYPIDTRDENQKLVFHCDHPLKLLAGESNAPDVYTYQKGNVTFGNRQGIRVLSPETISFHYMDAAHMYMYDFLLYDLRRHL